MWLYDGKSPVDWFYHGRTTFEEMGLSSVYRAVTQVPCVIFDNGCGQAYGFDTLEHQCQMRAVPFTGDAQGDYGRLVESIDGTYRAPGVDEVEEKADAAQTAAQTASETAASAQAAADEAKGAVADATSAAQTAAEAAATAQTTADEAKELASQAGTDPQLKTIAKLAAASIDFAEVSATDVVAIPDYIPEWSTLIGQKLKHNSPCRYNGTIYRASQDVTVQDIYPPDVAGESQYYPIEVAPDGIIVYRTCHGAYDQVLKGEKRHYPDADGPVYIALENTAYSPDTYPQHWKLVEDE